jgi:hypothetical protein
MIFGCAPTIAERTIDENVELVITELYNHPNAKIKFPNENEKQHFASLVHAREPTVPDVIGFSDGLSVAYECSDDPEEQSAAYNGYHHDT